MNATEENEQEEIEMDIINKLYTFVENGGRLEKGRELENFCTGTQDGKLDMLNAIADAYGYVKQEVAIVDDYWYQLERASDAGFVAYFPLQIVNFMKIYKI